MEYHTLVMRHLLFLWHLSLTSANNIMGFLSIFILISLILANVSMVINLYNPKTLFIVHFFNGLSDLFYAGLYLILRYLRNT